MTDIVERLRLFVPHCEDPNDYLEDELLFLKAADEIERLREERDEARRGEHRENENTPTWAELTAYWKARAEELERDRVVAPHATTENERLREALKQVGLYAWQGDTFKVMDIVRSAIMEKETV